MLMTWCLTFHPQATVALSQSFVLCLASSLKTFERLRFKCPHWTFLFMTFLAEFYLGGFNKLCQLQYFGNIWCHLMVMSATQQALFFPGKQSLERSRVQMFSTINRDIKCDNATVVHPRTTTCLTTWTPRESSRKLAKHKPAVKPAQTSSPCPIIGPLQCFYVWCQQRSHSGNYHAA